MLPSSSLTVPDVQLSRFRFFMEEFRSRRPASLAQEVALGPGEQAGERRLRQVATEAGFNRFRLATETPFNLIFEVRAYSDRMTCPVTLYHRPQSSAQGTTLRAALYRASGFVH